MADIASLIEQRSRRWMQAWVDLGSAGAGESARAVLEDSLAPDYALIVSAMPGERMDRARWLATCDRYVCTHFDYRDIQIRELAPGLAVMSAVADQVATLGGTDRSGAFFVTDVWRLEGDGVWRVCSRYSSHPEPAGMSARALQQV